MIEDDLRNGHMTNEIWESWLAKLDETNKLLIEREWIEEPFSKETKFYNIRPGCTDFEIKRIQEANSIRLPDDFIEVATRYSAGLEIARWECPVKDLPAEYNGSYLKYHAWRLNGYFSSNPLWEIPDSKDFRWGGPQDTGWSTMEDFGEGHAEFVRIWSKRGYCLNNLGNGDMIAIDLSWETEAAPVLYFSHDDPAMHGIRLGYSFIDYIDRIISFCCADPEQIAKEAYDSKQHIIDTDNILKVWKRQLLEVK